MIGMNNGYYVCHVTSYDARRLSRNFMHGALVVRSHLLEDICVFSCQSYVPESVHPIPFTADCPEPS